MQQQGGWGAPPYFTYLFADWWLCTENREQTSSPPVSLLYRTKNVTIGSRESFRVNPGPCDTAGQAHGMSH